MRYRVFLVIAVLIIGQFLLLGSKAGGEDLPREKTVIDDMETFEKIVLIPPGEDFQVTYLPRNGELNPSSEPYLEEICREAIDMVPEWMRINLTHKFRLLSSGDRQLFARLIVDSPDERYIDEIGFVIAHSTPQTLSDENFFPEIITHNAELIYEYDEYLDYVEIVEKDDHTTLAYRQEDNSSVELPREYYYWFVVHPKLGDELPTYVDPDYDYTSEPPFDRNRGAEPPVGKFWRDWFFVYNKTGQPLLKESLSGKNTTLDAIKGINGWIGKSMVFTSDNERPVQPVRIYVKGQGRCGEYQDMRSAAARAGLIPVIATSNSAEDHVWCEFWDLEWYHWDGTIDNPRMYEKGWGKTISSVWNTRGDGYSWSVTSRYSDVSTITARVVDLNGLPVDGADIDVYTENFYQPEVRSVTYSDVTDSSGEVSFELGDERNYWGRADTTELGSDPVNPVTQNEIALNTSAGEEYEAVFRLPQAAPRLQVIEVQGGHAPGIPPHEPGDPYFSIDFEVIGQITRGNARVAPGRFDLYQEGGNIDFFLGDAPNMIAYDSGTPASGYYVQERINNFTASPQISTDRSWSYVLSNGFSQQTYKVIKLIVKVQNEMTLTIETPEDGQEVSIGELFEITGTVGPSRYYPTVEISLDGTHWGEATITDEDENGTFYWTAYLSLHVADPDLLPPLPITMEIYARMEGNNESMVGTWIDLVDNTPPTIIADLDKETVKEGETITLSGSLYDNVAYESLEYSMDNSRYTYPIELTEGSRRFSMEISTSSMDHGTHQIHLFATDIYDNRAERILEFEVLESEKPELEIISPPEGAVLRSGAPITIEGKARDNVMLSELSVSLMDTRSMETIDLNEIDSRGMFSYVFDYSSGHAGEDGDRIILLAKDKAENEQAVSTNIFFDSSPPSIELGHARRMVVPANSDIEIFGSLSDDHTIDKLEMKINNRPWEEARFLSLSETFSIELDTSFDLLDGDNVVMLRATDGVGWETEEEIVVTVDETPPEVEFDTDIEYVMKGDQLNMRILIEEMFEIRNVKLSISGSGTSDVTDQLDVAELELSIDSSDLRTGMVELTITATDEAGNIGEAEYDLHVITDTLDTDSDGVPDWWEYQHGMDPFSFDSDQDPDGDGYTNLEEFLGDDGEWGEVDDSTDPRSSASSPSRGSIEGPNTVFFIILGIVLILGILILVGFLLTRRKIPN